MVATILRNRIAVSPATELPELPVGARARGRLWSDAVFQAVMALQAQLTHPDAAVVAAAAGAILGLEQTRMRHSTQVAGSEEVSEAQEDFEDERQDAEEAEVEGRLNARAVAGHADELSAGFAAAGQAMPCDPVKYVRAQLRIWGVAATAIPAGGFAAHLAAHGAGVTPADPARE